jgi:sulfonate transport system ATP-binding protein
MSLFFRYSGAPTHGAPRAGDAPAAQAASHRSQAPPLGLKLSALNKRFGTRHVLKNIDLTVAPGEFVAIVGRSGCGKSTLLRLLAGLEQPSDASTAASATSSREAIAVEGAGPLGARLQTRIMFQDARLLPWKRVLDNVALGLPASERTHAREVLSLVGLSERAADWPAVLSGGQRQRVALARALVHRPRLLLLDEPLGALDALTRIEMQQLIEDVWQRDGFTSILVTHDVSEAVALADRVIVIEEGQIVFNEKVNLARPRVRGSAAFAALEGRVLNRVLKQPDASAKPPPPPPAPIQIRHLRIAV